MVTPSISSPGVSKSPPQTSLSN